MKPKTIHHLQDWTTRIPGWTHPCILFCVVFLAFSPSLFFDFITYDDPEFVTNNPNVNSGLTPENIRWALISPGDGNLWSPLTSLSHQLDVSLFGLNPTWHHAANIIWHALAACLLFLICRKRLLSLGWSYFIILFWAIHPQKIQSVAWISERKGVLSGALFFASILLFSHWKSNQPKRSLHYLLSLFLFAAAALAKPSTLPLPFVLFLICYLDPKKITFSFRNALRPLTPFLIVGLMVATGIIYFRSQGTLNEIGHSDSILERFQQIVMSYVFYIKRFVVPTPSQLLFSPPTSAFPFLISLFVLFIFVFTIRQLGKQNKLISLGAITYTLLWLPVSGIIPISHFYVADRYSYLPQIGLIIMFVGTAQITFTGKSQKLVLPLCLATLAMVYLVFLQVHLPIWKNSKTLFGHEMTVNQSSSVAALHYGEFHRANDPEKALRYYQIAHERAPQEGVPLTKMGMTQLSLNEPKLALGSFQKATQVSNPVPETWTQLLLLQVDLAMYSHAEQTVIDGMEKFPYNWPIIMNGANFHLLVKKDPEKALPLFLKAFKLKPKNSETIRACAKCYRALDNDKSAAKFEGLLDQ